MRRPLTWHIEYAKQSQIGQFLLNRFKYTESLTMDANHLLRKAKTLLPAVPISPYVSGMLGMAIDYRIRYSFDITPSRELAAFTGAHELLYLSGALMDRLYSSELIDLFFARLDTTLQTIQPVRRKLEPAEEQTLARYCFVLALFEVVYRNPKKAQQGWLFELPPKKSVDELLAIPDDTWIADLCAMATLFYDNYHDLLSHHYKLNPGFMGIGGIANSDGDLIIDGCLIEIKASKNSMLNTKWLRQLVGYLLLDYNDTHNIHSVSIYMARQGLLLPPWSVSEFLHLLTGDNTVTLTQLRQEFRTLAEKVVEEKRNEEKPVQIIVDQSLPLTWIRQRRLDISILNLVLDNFCKNDNPNTIKLKNEVDKFISFIRKSILTAPSGTDKSFLEKITYFENRLTEFSQNDLLIAEGKSVEEVILIVRQLQISIRDVFSILNSALQ